MFSLKVVKDALILTRKGKVVVVLILTRKGKFVVVPFLM
jgi:hypothetical protein